MAAAVTKRSERGIEIAGPGQSPGKLFPEGFIGREKSAGRFERFERFRSLPRGSERLGEKKAKLRPLRMLRHGGACEPDRGGPVHRRGSAGPADRYRPRTSVETEPGGAAGRQESDPAGDYPGASGQQGPTVGVDNVAQFRGARLEGHDFRLHPWGPRRRLEFALGLF